MIRSGGGSANTVIYPPARCCSGTRRRGTTRFRHSARQTPAQEILIPLDPNFKAEFTAFFNRPPKATRLSNCWATFSANHWASFRVPDFLNIDDHFMLDLLSSSRFRLSIWPLFSRLQCRVGRIDDNLGLIGGRSTSIWAIRPVEPFFQEIPDQLVFLDKPGKIPVGKPPGTPDLVVPQPESNRMYFLSQPVLLMRAYRLKSR